MSEPAAGAPGGWAVTAIDRLGDGPGFRKVREAVGLKAFGANAIVLPPRWETAAHYHDRQEELYFVHRGPVEFSFDEGPWERLDSGGLARVSPAVTRRMRNVEEREAVVLMVGADGGYVGRDGHLLEGQTRGGGPLDADGA